ncbi:MAG TPA: chemotaxis protein CheW [Pseudomonadales bacterium]|nr:chemotaxis protein CheW [Pseudomonadales bacterium]
MSSMLEQLWPIFLDEVSEKLDTVESMVITNSDDSANIDALFREFHTLKSSFSMVDFKTPMDLAHACEDVLHGLRKFNSVPSQEIRKYLLESIDWIKQQLAIASPGQYPQQANETLLAQLAPFRITEDAPPDSTIEDELKQFDEKEESAAGKIVEEKEALAVDTLRINSNGLDNLVTNVGQLAMAEDALSSIIHDEKISHVLLQAQQQLQKLQAGGDADSSIMEDLVFIFSQYRQTLLQADISIQATIASIQQEVLDLRIIPLSTIFNKLPRIIRQKANTVGKQVQLAIEGGEVSIDKGMVDIISEPLIHLLHNAVIHGIETTEDRQLSNKTDVSQIRIVASEQGSMLRIEVFDDGYGIDYRSVREKAIRKGFAREDDEHKDPGYWLNFLFVHGLNSENRQRTTGLDIVRDQLSSIGGAINIQSTSGKGTRFTMRMPLTVAIQSAILVRAAEQLFAIPARHLIEIIEVSPESLETHHNQAAINLRGNMLPVYRLSKLLNLEIRSKNNPIPSVIMLLVLQNENDSMALAIDDILGRQELFLREIHQDLRNIPGIGGISLLGNGNAVIILDCNNLFNMAKTNPETIEGLIC